MGRRQSIEVYLRKGCFLMCPQSQATSGAWISQQPGLGLDENAPDEVLGRALFLLRKYSVNGLDAFAWQGKRFELLALAGVKGWRGFITSAPPMVEVGFEKDHIRIERRLRQGNSYVADEDFRTVNLDVKVSDSELGGAVRKALTQ